MLIYDHIKLTKEKIKMNENGRSMIEMPAFWRKCLIEIKAEFWACLICFPAVPWSV